MIRKYRLTKRALALEALQFASIPLVFSLVWAVYKTYRETYQESLDKLKVKYLLPACVLLALVLTPKFKQGELYSYCWAISFYVDVLALLPQVVMMTASPGKKSRSAHRRFCSCDHGQPYRGSLVLVLPF